MVPEKHHFGFTPGSFIAEDYAGTMLAKDS
jgi:hypothetical protein